MIVTVFETLSTHPPLATVSVKVYAPLAPQDTETVCPLFAPTMLPWPLIDQLFPEALPLV
jgi:hypothetical protein